MTHKTGDGLDITLGFSFSTLATTTSGETFQYAAIMAWGRDTLVSYPSDAVSLGLCGAGKCFSLTPVF